MSSHPKGERIALDAYYTKDEVARAIVERVSLMGVNSKIEDSFAGRAGRVVCEQFKPRTILEPSVGGGAFVRACREVWPDIQEIHGCDVDGGAAGLDDCRRYYVGDFIESESWCKYDLIIGNPPYRHAEEHIRHALTLLAPGGVCAMLLRVGFMGSKKRRAFFADYPVRRMDVLRPRPSFTNGGTDSSEYGVFYWGDVAPGIGHIDYK